MVYLQDMGHPVCPAIAMRNQWAQRAERRPAYDNGQGKPELLLLLKRKNTSRAQWYPCDFQQRHVQRRD
jgi:hypothetical protein